MTTHPVYAFSPYRLRYRVHLSRTAFAAYHGISI